MQGVGLDRIDLARRPPAQQQQECHPQQQAAETRNQHGAQRLDTRLAGKPLRDADVKQQRVQGGHRHTHRQHHHAANGSDHRRQDHQARFMGANERP
jgi:hypothetical protein